MSNRSVLARPKNRAGLCTFTFADGRHCRTPRSSTHPHLCYFHARKEDQARAADEIGDDISYFFSGRYLSASDLRSALARLFTGVVQGQIKPKTAATLAYLSQTMLQTIPLAEHEYITTFGPVSWSKTVHSNINQNCDRISGDSDQDQNAQANVSQDAVPAAGQSEKQCQEQGGDQEEEQHVEQDSTPQIGPSSH